MSRAERYFFGVLGCFAAAWISAHVAGCATGAPGTVTHDVPNLSQVEPGVWRGGQPTSAAGWAYLRGLGLTNDIKLNTGEEASDQAAVDAGFRVFYFPIDTMQQLVDGPDPVAMQEVAARLWVQGTYVHCEHGQDRTGLAVGLHRLEQGMTPASAWSEMTNHGYHPALLGLTTLFPGAGAQVSAMRSIARYGWIPDRPDKRDVKFCASPAVDTASTPDWSAGMPACWDQGQIGSCTGNMFAAQAFFLRMKQGGPAILPSRLFSYWVGRAREGSTGSDSGAQIRDIIAGAICDGICPDELWPYDTTQVLNEPSEAAFAPGAVLRGPGLSARR